MAYYLGLKFVIVVQSLPLLLLAEEMQLLKEKGLVRLTKILSSAKRWPK